MTVEDGEIEIQQDDIGIGRAHKVSDTLEVWYAGGVLAGVDVEHEDPHTVVPADEGDAGLHGRECGREGR